MTKNALNVEKLKTHNRAFLRLQSYLMAFCAGNYTKSNICGLSHKNLSAKA
jgi:hypothetical protein